MINLIKKFLEKKLFNNFFTIDLTNSEKNTAHESVDDKYAVGIVESLKYGVLAFPAILFMDVSLLVSVLIPITMVSGTAWFAVSLVNIKKKFENFGNELTKDLYRSFCTSLVLLSLITLVSLNKQMLIPVIEFGSANIYLFAISGILGTYVVFKMIYDVFAGATKYDMNDSMLTGQNEAADKYFKRSLSLLNTCADNLRLSNNNIETTGYYLGLAFFEVFNYVKNTRGSSDEVFKALEIVDELKNTPPTDLNSIKTVSINLIEKFLMFVLNTQEKGIMKSVLNIKQELSSIRDNESEGLELLSMRMATILEETEDMLVSQGEALFTKRLEIERKYLVKNLPELSKLNSKSIIQGYISTSNSEEERVRKIDVEYTHTVKKIFPSGYREEIEKNISKETFEKCWPNTEGRRIEKVRYIMPLLDGNFAEIDVFAGKNKGLILAEVEFNSEDDAKNFKKPNWFGDEVTDNPEYKNASLAK